jgi:DNA polymerase-3 subunit epsilon
MSGWLSNLRARYLFRGRAGHAVPCWLADLPASILFVDVQTTGLSAADRVVTFGAVQLTTAPLLEGAFELETAHLIFNPRRVSFTRAEEVHGYSDWILRHQDKFYLHADRIEDLLESSDLIVIHDAEFGRKFLNRELALDGRHPIWRPTFCTLKAYQRLRRRGGASLDAICEHLGLPHPSQPQSALERAWLVMLAYLWLSKCPYRPGLPAEVQAGPSNLKAPPRLPASLMPKGQAHTNGLIRRPPANPDAGPFRMAAHPVPTRETAAPVVRPAPAPTRAVPAAMPAPASIAALGEEPVRLSEFAQAPTSEVQPANPVETTEAVEGPAPAPPEAVHATPADASITLPTNDLTPCVDDSPATGFAERPFELPEVLMPETDAAAMPPDDLLRSPANAILPTLSFDGERPTQAEAQEYRLLAD